MIPVSSLILTVNGGSSSIKFALFELIQPVHRILSGEIARIGLTGSTLRIKGLQAADSFSGTVVAPDFPAAVRALLDWIESRLGHLSFAAIGHRVVHGGPNYFEAQHITCELVTELQRFSPFDPEHLPAELRLIEAFQQQFPNTPQVACFDTAFHHNLPRVAQLLPIPRRYATQGVRRYGFHGLSYTFLLSELRRLAGPQAAQGRIILAHLGNGASLAAVRDGQPIDTSMGFTPTAGLVMSTRSGDLDPGLALFLSSTEQMTAVQFQHLVNHESGLLGISETSSDMRDLLIRATSDDRAREAVQLFCYQAKKWIGSFAAALGGLDALVFSAGIGENCPEVRAQICEGLEFLGIDLDADRNLANGALISTDTSLVSVRVIHTDEELVIAESVTRLLTSNSLAKD